MDENRHENMQDTTLENTDAPLDGSHWDVVVVGGGAGGLNAALVLARARRSVLVIDAGLPRNRFAAHMHGFLTRDGFPPGELLELGRAEVLGYGATIVEARATTVTGEAGDFEVVLDDGRAVHARRLVVATGLRDVLPELDGLAEQWGRGAVACPYCDGWEARDTRIGVIATTPMSTHQATLVRQWSADVTFIGPLTRDLDPELRTGLEARGTRILSQAVTAVLSDAEGVLTGVALDDGSTVELDRLFVGPRMVANDELLRQLGAATAEGPMGEWTAADPMGLTSVPGVWVAGNSANAGALVIVAAAAGATAATAINADLTLDDVRAAVAAGGSAGAAHTVVAG